MDKMFAEQMERELEGIATLSERQMEQFYQYYEMLVEWNQVMNLTAITEMTEVVTKHFVDSLSLKKAVSDLEDKPRKIMDVGTLLSRWEGFGLVLPEYMVCGVPIVATDVDAIPNIIEDKKHNWVVEKDNFEMVSEKVFLLKENNKSKKIETHIAKYSGNKMANYYDNFYKKLMFK